MCEFFSCISDGNGKLYYFGWHLRQDILAGRLGDITEADSHTSIARHFGLNEDACNKYEINPLTGRFGIDQINTRDDSNEVYRQLETMDWEKIVAPLVVKPIVNPLDVTPTMPLDQAVELLHRWVDVQASVGASVGASVWASVQASVGASVGASVWASVRASVGASAGASAWDSVGSGINAYVSSFFDLPCWECVEHEPGVNPFQPAIDLWAAGYVASFDGATWRLHTGPKAHIVYEEICHADHLG